MVSRLTLLLALTPLALTGCMKADAASAPYRSKAPAARITGEPISCVRTYEFNETRVRDNRTIDFMRNSRQGWRNTLSNDCPGLAAQNGFTYETSTNELCSVDVVYVLETAGGLRRGPACGLGQFVPIELAPRH
ncbi:MAG: hypothetical protein JWQ16_3281 [Novosphingobium sp.]|nr:hypothetical protein [Novosphingobium sp.]